MTKENDRRLKPIDVSKYTVTESGNVIRTDNKETLKNALERITELEIENAELRAIAENQQSSNMERYFKNKELEKEAEDFVMGVKAKEAIQEQIPYFKFAQEMYLAGAEPREKRIAELEKENAKYKEMVEDMKADMCSTKSKVLCDYLIGILEKYKKECPRLKEYKRRKENGRK